MVALAVTPRTRRWLLFLFVGGTNTVVSYGIYLALNLIWSYQSAYLVSYVLGICLSYLLNSRFVFRIPLSWRGIFAYPLVYLIQYLASAAALGTLVEVLHVHKSFAPLIVTAIMIPLTYSMSRLVLQLAHKTNSRPER